MKRSSVALAWGFWRGTVGLNELRVRALRRMFSIRSAAELPRSKAQVQGRERGWILQTAPCLAILLATSSCWGSPREDSPESRAGSQNASPLSDATIWIIRHAEKPAAGAGLSSEGQERAKAYVRYFQNLRLDSLPARLDYLVAADA